MQPDDVAVGQPAYQVVINDPEPAGIQIQTEGSSVRRYSRATKGITSSVEGLCRDDRDDAPVPAQVVQEPVVGDLPDDEGVQPDDVAVGQSSNQIVINDP